MLVVDTDLFSIITRGTSPEADRVRDRIRNSGQWDAITIVTVEEQMRGRLAACHRAKAGGDYVLAARLLRQTLDDLGRVNILDFDEAAAEELKRLIAQKVRVGTKDLQIAAITLANNATLITRNLSDFRKVPRLRAEDWTK